MSEMQKPVLEHASPETQEKDLTRVLDSSEGCKEFAGIKTVTPLSVRTTETGFCAEISKEELARFLASDPTDRFYVEGVPVSAFTDLVREVLCSAGGTSPM
jgi:hypothetical protein